MGGCFQVKTLDGMSYTVIYESCLEMGLDLMSAVRGLFFFFLYIIASTDHVCGHKLYPQTPSVRYMDITWPALLIYIKHALIMHIFNNEQIAVKN